MDLIGILTSAATNPVAYSVIFFTYAILAAVILPIPVEIGLFNFHMHPALLVIILALGKGVGALIVFEIGGKARDKMEAISYSNAFIRKITEYSEWFVKNWGYYGLLLVLSTPLMIDSISLYLFSLLNPKEDGRRAMDRNWFTVINVIAGAIRGIITLAVFYYVGYRLV